MPGYFLSSAALIGCMEDLGSARLGPVGIALFGERCGSRRVCSPSLSCWAWSATDHLRPQLVTLNERAPIAQFLIVFWPLIVLAVAVPLAGQARSLAGFLAAVFLGLLVFTELFNFFDGGYSGEFARFNAALKWWGWIFTGGVFAISAFLLASDRRAVRVVAAITLVLVSVFALDSGRIFAFRGFSGKIDGSRFYAQDLSNARMMDYLANAPRGIVLEKVYEERPIDTGIYGSFAVKPSLVGVPWILNVWKRDLTELPGLIAEIKSFYAGSHRASSSVSRWPKCPLCRLVRARKQRISTRGGQ